MAGLPATRDFGSFFGSLAGAPLAARIDRRPCGGRACDQPCRRPATLAGLLLAIRPYPGRVPQSLPGYRGGRSGAPAVPTSICIRLGCGVPPVLTVPIAEFVMNICVGAPRERPKATALGLSSPSAAVASSVIEPL